MNESIKKKLPFIIIALIILGPILNSKIGPILVLAIIFFILFKYIKKYNHKNMAKTIDVNQAEFFKKAKRGITFFVAFIIIVWLFFASIQIVEAGETGVYSLFGRVKDKELRSGFHLVIPLAKINKMSIRTEEYTMSIATNEGKKLGNDSITSLTKEGLKVDLDMTVLYHLNEEKASDVYREVGLKYDEKLIRPAIRTTIREIVAQYNAKDLYSEKRAEAAGKIMDSLKEKLGERGIVIEDVLLRNVALPANLAQSIQEKLQAEQEAQKYDFILDKEKKEKERKIIEAEGQRDAQRIINESLTDRYLYYQYIKELEGREGTIYVPTSPSTGMPLFRNIGN
ncbi:prohibitin family protein [Candidatus Falkowbacteria bacterium]|nr:prohibitin family protein [Candidatus Falkowbacteria bacterium]